MASPSVNHEPAGDADLASVGRLLAEPARARILMALDDGRALPAGLLAAEAGIAASTASGHLGALVGGGLLSVEAQGRHRYYRLSRPEVGVLIETMAGLAPRQPIRSLRQGTRAAALRRARTCYDHLAGRLGVAIFESLLAGSCVRGGDGRHHPDRPGRDRLAGPGREIDYRLTRHGRSLLEGLGIEVPPGAAPGEVGLRYCVDWTEQRHHLSGALGRAVATRLVAMGWLERAERSRAVHLTPVGRRGLEQRLGVDLTDF